MSIILKDRTVENDTRAYVRRLEQEVRDLAARCERASAEERHARKRIEVLESALAASWKIPAYATRRAEPEPAAMKTG